MHEILSEMFRHLTSKGLLPKIDYFDVESASLFTSKELQFLKSVINLFNEI